MQVRILSLFGLGSFLFLAATTAQADEVMARLKIGDVTYTNADVTSVTATDIFFISSQGMGNAKLKDLDPDLQKHFHYDPTKVAAAAAMVTVPAAPTSGHTADPMPDPHKKLWANSFLNQRPPKLIVEKWLTPIPNCQGKFVLIDFWATWCPPCRAAIPELNGYQKEFGDKLVVIGVTDQDEAAVRELTNPKIEYAIAIDTQSRTKNAVGVTGIPHVLLIDPQGYVRWEGFPFLDGYELSSKAIADIIAKYSN